MVTNSIYPVTATAAASQAPGNVSSASSLATVRGNKTTNPHLKRSQPSSSTSATNKSGKSPNSGSTTTATTLQIKKRPYRRTKRPKNYCDKSTVTTVTTPTRQDEKDCDSTNPDGTNVYDAVLGECEDLLRASTEAQRLGRLKMASAYQLLLHTRLVGLGKRFDRSAMMVDHQKARQQAQQQQQQAQAQKKLDLEASLSSSSNPLGKDDTGGSSVLQMQPSCESNSQMQPSCESNSKKADSTNTPVDGKAELAATPSPGGGGTPVPGALEQLRSILPGNLEMDASMMEHLARAAVELHHQRTGRRKSADGLLASPLNGGLAAAATTMVVAAVSSENNNPKEATGVSTNSKASTKKSSVAWTPSETAIVIKALKEGKDNYTIASTLLPNKTVAQVHAFVKNQQQLHKVNKLTQRQQQQHQQQTGNATTTPTSSSTSVVLQDASKPQAVPSSTGTNASDVKDGAAEPSGDKAITPPKRGGRGRKPPTTAMNTVPNVSMDVRALLRTANQKKKNSAAAHGNGDAASSSSNTGS